MELLAAPGLHGITGRVELSRRPGPFTVDVGADGRPRTRLILLADGLPSPASLGPYHTFVAWLTPPTMDSVTRLGRVGNGTTELGTVRMEKFTILLTAERNAQGQEPAGRIVLRGQSPATRLFPPDLMQFSVGSMPNPAGRTVPGRGGAGGGHMEAHGGMPAGIRADSGAQVPMADTAGPAAAEWTSVPMPRGLTMLPAEMALRPDAAAWLPPSSGPTPRAGAPAVVRLRSGDTLRLEAGLVRRSLAGRTATMFAFNGQQPGPLLEVERGAEITVRLVNHLPQPTTVHWHGVRLDNVNDGIPDLTQPAVPPGGAFTYHVRFPDAGLYWYHPHVREDTQQELGLYGNILVRPSSGTGFGPVNREAVLMLDDVLLTEAGQVPFGRESPSHALMGRFGNVLLVNGEPRYRLGVRRGEVVRFYLTNAANARTLNLSFSGAKMKVVGADVGALEREAWVESVVIAPAERYVVHVRFDRPGQVALVNRVRGLDHLYGRFFEETDTLGVVEVARAPIERDLQAAFTRLRADTTTTADIQRFRRLAMDAPVRTLTLSLEAPGLAPVTRRLMQLDSIYFAPVEWSGTMPMMNWAATGRQLRWILRDPATGRENMDIDWHLRRGEPVRIRLVNPRETVHAMQHPIHFHGQRFLVLAVNGVPNEDLAWKDTVLVPAGGAVDILLDPSNPGRWMGHCHIAEHLSAGMMMEFTVE
jgi:FtsP/CotA-like multicopper oxidase with cupredoxin domain